MEEISNLEQAIAALEAQRGILGDNVVDTALAPMREKLAALQARQPLEQRRLVTVLFADLVGFTAQSERMDAEDMREILNLYLARWAECIEEHGGAVEKFIGDAVMAIYGLSTAQEDDPKQAIFTALRMLDELEKLNQGFEQRYRIHLAMRVGIHTGPVVVSTLGERKGQDFVAVGDTVNLASRLQSAAPENGILISHDTYQHIRGAFDALAHPPIQVKGKSRPVRVYQVSSEKQRDLRSSGRGIEGVATPMIGRQEELAQLQKFYMKASQEAKTQVVTITGEPGLGKSRLLLEFKGWLAAQRPQATQFKAIASEQVSDNPYWLWREAFAQRYQILESDSLETTRAKLEQGLAGYFDQDGRSKTHFIGMLFGFDFSDSPYLQGLREDHRQLRQRAGFYLEQLFVALSKEAPVVLAFDDIHWADAPSLDILHSLAQNCPDLPVLIVCLSRTQLDDVHPRWREQQSGRSDSAGWIDLKPLSPEESGHLLGAVLQKMKSMPEDLYRLAVSTAEGNPFYLEEIVRMLVDDGVIRVDRETGEWQVGAEELDALRVPSTLIAVLQARLDSLPPIEREILQQASVVGRTFWDLLLQHLRGTSRPLEGPLGKLERRVMIAHQPHSTFEGCHEYSFQHALQHEVVYEMVLKKTRQAYHGKIAAWLAENARRRGRERELAALIARQYALSGAAAEAADWYLQAGRYAHQRGSLVESRRFLDLALEALPVEYALSRWEVLFEHDRVLGSIGELQARQADDQALLALAQELGDDQHLAIAYQQIATTCGYLGDNRQALEAIEAGLSAARRCGNREVEASVSSFKIACLIQVGEIEQAGRAVDQALALAEDLVDEDELARTLTNVSLYYSAIGDLTNTIKVLERQVEICARLGWLIGEGVGKVNLGYNFILLGFYAQAVEVLERSIQIAVEIGARRDRAYSQLNLGLAYQRQGNVQAARQEYEEAIRELEVTGDVFGLTEGLVYLAGALELEDEVEQASQLFSQAKEVFQGKEMHGYAIDAQAGLARCLLKLSRTEQARLQAGEVLDYLSLHGTQSLEFPLAAYLACAEVLDAVGDQERSAIALRKGFQELTDRAGRISEPAWRQNFLENVPENHTLRQLYQQRFGTPA